MPTYHYVQNEGKLMMQSRENGEEPQLGKFFDDFEAKYLEIANFSEKCFIQIEGHIYTNFWANLETFSRISPNQELFLKIRLCDFSTFIVL